MGICEDAPDEYCGHVLEPKDGEADEDWHESVRNAVCLRDPKYDGLCVWHADTNEKTTEELIESRLTPDNVPWEAEYLKENLNGAILRRIEFPDGFSFSGCVLVFAEFSDAELEEADFSRATIHSADFPHTALRRTDFQDASLRGTNFHDADLRGTNFHDADLEEAGFSRATLHSADFPRATLRRADFQGASLRYADFPHANLAEAKFPDADLIRTKFPGAHLSYSEFPDAMLGGAEFPDAMLGGAEFPDAMLGGAEFPDAYLFRAQFSDANLEEAQFPDANLEEADFPRANLNKVDFSRANLEEANFPRANLEEAVFSETNLYRITLTEADLRDAEFSDADLRYATFRPAHARVLVSKEDTTTDPLGATLEDAQFEDGTDLRGANLSGARLYQTTFRDVRINDETQFGIDREDDGKPGEACRYDYDERTGVSINEDTSRLEAAVWTYRRLESLFEENAMDERARDTHIRKQEAQRAQYKEQVQEGNRPRNLWLKSLRQYIVSGFNWHVHRHGESLKRLLSVSGLLITFCGLVYAGAGIARNNPQTTYQLTLTDLTQPGAALVDVINGLYFSVITFSTIGYGDFYPTSPLSRLFVGIESLSGALLIALFVFVIGRRVAR